MGLKCGAPFLPLGYTLWCSVITSDLLVVALHEALKLWKSVHPVVCCMEQRTFRPRLSLAPDFLFCIILQRYLKTHFYLPPRPLGGGAEPSQANSESGSGQQQAHSSFTAASHKHVVGQQPL